MMPGPGAPFSPGRSVVLVARSAGHVGAPTDWAPFIMRFSPPEVAFVEGLSAGVSRRLPIEGLVIVSCSPALRSRALAWPVIRCVRSAPGSLGHGKPLGKPSALLA